METTCESFPDSERPLEPPAGVSAAAAVGAMPARASLPPKGSCWYCEKPLDSVKRFCGKPCANSFDEEAGFIR